MYCAYPICLTLSLLFLSSQLEKRGERRAEAEKMLAQAQELGTVNSFVIILLNNSFKWQESSLIEFYVNPMNTVFTADIKISIFKSYRNLD